MFRDGPGAALGWKPCGTCEIPPSAVDWSDLAEGGAIGTKLPRHNVRTIPAMNSTANPVNRGLA